jgi:hypothetical protein
MASEFDTLRSPMTDLAEVQQWRAFPIFVPSCKFRYYKNERWESESYQLGEGICDQVRVTVIEREQNRFVRQRYAFPAPSHPLSRCYRLVTPNPEPSEMPAKLRPRNRKSMLFHQSIWVSNVVV